MEKMLSIGLSPAALAMVNRCRMFLQVVYLSDMVDEIGQSVTGSAWKGQRDITRNTPYDWPKQGVLSEAYWNLWRESLAKCWCSPTR
jgi:hypothetical protein